MVQGSASLVVVVWTAGLVCRVGVGSASLVVVVVVVVVDVVWSAGLVCREGVRSASLVVVVDCARCSSRVARLFAPSR